MSKGVLVILSGPSGVGKDTVIDAWRAQNGRVQRVVAYTTRQPREGEQNGLDYHFVTKDQFFTHVQAGDFLEYKEVHGNFYATPLKDMEAMLAAGKIAILKIDTQGALNVMGLRPDAVTIFILPPSGEELERRIKGRGTDDWAAIEKRLDNARAEIAVADKYRYRIVNIDVKEVVAQLEEITR
jgi:guanylate kinase